jgi:hypothetical protein
MKIQRKWEWRVPPIEGPKSRIILVFGLFDDEKRLDIFGWF